MAGNGRFQKGHDPRRHIFTTEECIKGYKTAVQNVMARYHLKRKVARAFVLREGALNRQEKGLWVEDPECPGEFTQDPFA